MRLHPKSFMGVARSTPFLAWAEEGLSPGKMRDRMIAILSPYLTHPSVLDGLPIEVLAFEAVSVSRSLWIRGVVTFTKVF